MKITEEQRAIGDLLAPELVELIESRQTAAARAALLDLLDPEITEVLVVMEPRHRVIAFRLLPRDRAADVFTYFDQEEQEQLVEQLSSDQAASIFNEMDPDDRVQFFEDAPDQLVGRLMALMHPAERAETERILEYPEESIGRIMTTEYMTVRPEWTGDEALGHLRRYGGEAETIYTLYVVDEHGRLINHLSLRSLILAHPDRRVSACLKDNAQTIRLNAADDREQAVKAMEFYDLPVVPVVDATDRLVGIVTFDDVADVAEEEVTEDIQKIGGMEALEMPYLATPLPLLVRKRGVWLAVLFGGGLLTVTAMGFFKESIERYAILALFVPLIIASGGNSGSQAATLTVRALALGELKLKDWAAVLRRELAAGLVLGTGLGVIGLGVGAMAGAMGLGDAHVEWAEAVRFGLAIGTAVVGVVMIGTLTGSMLPFLLQRMGLDPATSSTPFVATIVDVAGLLIYFIAANVILRGVLW